MNPSRRINCLSFFVAVAAMLFAGAPLARALPVRLELVEHDKPDTTLDKLERQRPIYNAVATNRGMEMKKVGLDLVCWARNVRVDNQPVFERYHEGKYVDRLPVAQTDLAAGQHVIWPGDHAFTVAADGKITTDDAELLVDGSRVRIKCYPVTVRAFRANPDEADLPMSMRVAPLPNLTVRESADAEKSLNNAMDLLPVFDQFAPLTIWLPANTVGKGYLAHPVGLTFHLNAAGVTAGAGGGQSVEGLRVSQNLIDIPVYGFKIVGHGGGKAIVPGVEQFAFYGTSEKILTMLTNWYPRRQPYELRVSEAGPALTIDGDVKKLPFKSFRVDPGDVVNGTQRILSVEIDARRFAPGATFAARIYAIDSGPATLARKALDQAKARVQATTQAQQAAQADLTKADTEAKAAAADETAKAQAIAAANAKIADAKKTSDTAAAEIAAANQAVQAATAGAAAAQQAVATSTAKVAEATKANDTAKAELAAANKAVEAAKAAAAAAPPATAPATTEPAAAVAPAPPDPSIKAAEVAKAKADAAENALTAATAELAAATKASQDAAAKVAAANAALAAAQAKPAAAEAAAQAAQTELETATKAAEPLKGKAAEFAQALVIAQTRATAAAQALAAATADLPAKEAAAKAVETANPLATAVPFGQVQAYGSDAWTDLQVQGPQGDAVRVALPTLPDGIYKLRLGVRPTDPAAKPILTEQWIAIAVDRPVSIGLFTQRGRNAFLRGEPFWIGVGAMAVKEAVPAGSAIEVDLVDARGTRIPLLRDKTAAAIEPARRETFVARLDGQSSLSLAPGRYKVEAKLGAGAIARAIAIDMVEAEPRTHFTSMLSGKYNIMGSGGADSYSNVLGGADADALARDIAAMGYNTFMGMTYSVDRVYRQHLDLEQLVRETPALGPWESYYQPSGRDQFMNASVRNGLRFYEDVFTYNDTMLPQIPLVRDACERYASLEAISMRHNPAFKGVCLYDEFYESGESGTAPSLVMATFKAQEMIYREQHPGVTAADATKALDRFTSRPFGQRRYEDLEKFRSWTRHQDSGWSTFSERMTAAVKAVMPEARNFVQQRFWGANGGNLGPNGTANDVFDSLDIASCVMYKDGGQGDRPVFAPMQADVLRVRDDIPVWTQLHNYHASGLFGDHVMRQAFFGLSQRVDGFSFFTIEHDPQEPKPDDNRDAVRNIADKLCTPYGDLLLSMQRGYKKVAIYYSRQADYLKPRKLNDIANACEGLWVGCMRAGFPADFIYDEQIKAGRGAEYQVIFVPGIQYEDEMPPELLSALQHLVDAGKTIVVERSSKLPIERIVRMDSELDEYNDKLGGSFPRYTDFETEMVFLRSEETTVLMKSFLSKHIPPAAQHELLVGPDWLRCGQGEYMVLPNFARTEFKGLHKTLYQAPDRPTLKFPKRPPACYDMLEMKPVEVTTDGDRMSLRADLQHYPGKIYAFLPAAIDKVKLRAPAAARAGTDITYQVSVVDAQQKPIDAGFPLQITLLDSAGGVVYDVYRAGTPSYQNASRIPTNIPAGNWKLRVRELISGAIAEATIAVTAGELPPAKLDDRAVWVHDAAQVKTFLAAKDPIVIAVDDDQPWVRPQADRLQKLLTDRGRTARVARVNEIVRLPGPWDLPMPQVDGTRLRRGDVVTPGLFIDGPVIALGKRYENQLIEAMARRDALTEPISANFPASGKAVVDWVRRAFSNAQDAVFVMANDEAGLTRGIDTMLSADVESANVPIRPPLVKPQPAADAALVDAAAAAQTPSSMGDALAAVDRVLTLDADPATGRVLVGTFGFGQNLFCLGPDGKPVWKLFLPEHMVYTVCFYDGGKRVIAATVRGYHVFLLDAADGKVLEKFASTEWPDGHAFSGFWEGAIETRIAISVNTPLRQILVGGRSGLVAVDFDGKKMWSYDRALAITEYPKESEQNTAAEISHSVAVEKFAVSPDGVRVVYNEEVVSGSTPGAMPGTVTTIYRNVIRILDVRDGHVLTENNEDVGNRKGPGTWKVSWPANSPVPWVHTQASDTAPPIAAPLTADGKLGTFILDEGETLSDGGRIVGKPHRARRIDAKGGTPWDIESAQSWIDQLDQVSPDQSRLYRCDVDGIVRCINMADGKTVWDYKMPYSGVLFATSDGVVAGANNGVVTRLDAAGHPTWSVRMRDFVQMPEGTYAEYIRSAERRDVDSSAEFFPIGRDTPDDYTNILRTGIEQLVNGDFEAQDGWTTSSGQIIYSAPAQNGQRSLQLETGKLVSQRLQRRVIPSATYLLEFFYRIEDEHTKLVAGTLLGGAKESFTASTFTARPGEWTFGRLAVKTIVDTSTLDVGFEADGGGSVHVDHVSFRPIRFPSPNLLANTELHAVEPTYVKDIRVQYERIPASLREKLMARNRVAAFRTGEANTATIWTQEEAYLHNGRLDDIGQIWAWQPDNMGFSVVLTKAAYVSHLVLYLNNSTPDNVYTTISILANDMATKMPTQIALVRGNARRFVVVHFPKPVYTDLLKILPGFHGGHKECMTEIEVYGPLGGPETAGKPKALTADPESTPMYMGNPSHVMASLPDDAAGEFAELGRAPIVAAYLAGSTASDNLFTAGDASGFVRSINFGPAPVPPAPPTPPIIWPLATVTPLGTPARYAGRLLTGSADGKLHAIGDDSVPLWTFQTGGRVYSSPCPSGDDVFVGSDDGRLYKVDVDSGTLIWEFETGDKVRAAPAISGSRVIVPSWDGFLYCVDTNSGLKIWNSPIAKYTSGSPAIREERIYLGDEQGKMNCFNAADGKPVWQLDLGGPITSCPIVTANGALFVSETGNAALVALDGTLKWKVALDARVIGQPFGTKTQALIPANRGLLVIRAADGQPDPRFVAPTAPPAATAVGRVISVVKYKDKLCFTTGNVGLAISPQSGRTFVQYAGEEIVWGPKAAGAK